MDWGILPWIGGSSLDWGIVVWIGGSSLDILKLHDCSKLQLFYPFLVPCLQLLKVFVHDNLLTFEVFYTENNDFMDRHGKERSDTDGDLDRLF